MNISEKWLAEKLEFPKIIALLKKSCFGEVGAAFFDDIPIETNRLLILAKLKQVAECQAALAKKEPMPISRYEDVRETVNRLNIENFVLTQDMLSQVREQLVVAKRIFAFFTPVRLESYPNLSNIIKDAEYHKHLLESINRVIDEEGQVRPDASPELQRLRRQNYSLRRDLDKTFKQIIGEYRGKGWLTDNVESFRNGRRVLSVPAEHKRKIGGIIHDESATGRTAYIEPQGIITINNDIFNLEAEERREIYRIFKDLSDTLRPYTSLMLRYQQIIVHFDVVRAKAELALKLDAQLPQIVDEPHVEFLNARHPLLYLKNDMVRKETIPFDLNLHQPNRILLLSGPNAGGKTILMKAVGLLQLMTQAGLLIPVSSESKIGIFENIFVEIGDQQSLEDDLSTYSSHLRNMKLFLEKANEKSLMLIDEFGSGTDPKMGGAIAESLLKSFNKRKVFGLITTHFSNLKMFAYKQKGIVNGAMTFDKETLSPTYRLIIGRPGSSYAFEIAQKSGFGKDLLHYARHKAGESAQEVDQLLIDLQQEKKELEEKLSTLDKQQQNLDKLIVNYELLSKDLEYKRKKLKLDQKQQKLQQKAADDKALQQLIKELRETESVSKAKRAAKKLKKERNEMEQDVKQLDDQLFEQQKKKLAGKQTIEVGSHVKVRDSDTVGTIEAINKKQATLLVGQLRMTVKLRDLTPVGEPLELKREKGIRLPESKPGSSFNPKIDIRGMYREDALKVVQQFMEQAILANAGQLNIVHGKGSGILRKAVHDKLTEYIDRKQLSHPAPNQGGDGVTLVSLQ